jgi:soluble cytochrome b562
VWSRSTIASAALLAMLAGCGGSSGPSLSSFKQGFVADKAQFSKLGTDLGAAVRGAGAKSNTELAAEFGALSSRATQQAALLRQLKPPSKYKTEVASLASGIDIVATNLHTIAAAATAGDPKAARAAAETLAENAAKVKAADQAVSSQLGLPQTG